MLSLGFQGYLLNNVLSAFDWSFTLTANSSCNIIRKVYGTLQDIQCSVTIGTDYLFACDPTEWRKTGMRQEVFDVSRRTWTTISTAPSARARIMTPHPPPWPGFINFSTRTTLFFLMGYCTPDRAKDSTKALAETQKAGFPWLPGSERDDISVNGLGKCFHFKAEPLFSDSFYGIMLGVRTYLGFPLNPNFSIPTGRWAKHLILLNFF